MRGFFPVSLNGGTAVVEYESDAALRDTEQIPLQMDGGIESFLRREVLPCAPDAWHRPAKVRLGYEISFNRDFYKLEPMRSILEIHAENLVLENETSGLLGEILGTAA